MAAGLCVAVLGPDGAGKSTLVARLPGALGGQPLVVYMGVNRDSQTHALPTMRWAQRRIAPVPAAPEPVASASAASPARGRRPLTVLRALITRIHLLLDQAYRVGIGMRARRRGRTVIFDRYLYDAEVDAAAEGRPARERQVLRWIRRRFPAPDLVMVLDASGEVLFARKGEHDVERLDRLRRAYAEIAGDVPAAVTIDVRQDADAVLSEAVAAIERCRGEHR
jgi:thymidylate kinase